MKTQAERSEMRAKHYPTIVIEASGEETCGFCAEFEHGDLVPHPCDAAELLDDVDVISVLLEKSERRIKALEAWADSHLSGELHRSFFATIHQNPGVTC